MIFPTSKRETKRRGGGGRGCLFKGQRIKEEGEEGGGGESPSQVL